MKIQIEKTMRILAKKVNLPIEITPYSNGSGYSLNWVSEKQYEKEVKKIKKRSKT